MLILVNLGRLTWTWLSCNANNVFFIIIITNHNWDTDVYGNFIKYLIIIFNSMQGFNIHFITFRKILTQIKPHMPGDIFLVSQTLCKGLICIWNYKTCWAQLWIPFGVPGCYSVKLGNVPNKLSDYCERFIFRCVYQTLDLLNFSENN